MKGKVVMITDNDQSIGKATALKIAATDTTVLVIDREAERLTETKKEIEVFLRRLEARAP